jgi:hypothetical protein
MVKAWFDQLDFDVTADVKYTRDGKPYLSSVSIHANVKYDGKHKWIDAVVFPQKNKIVIEYLNDGELEVGETELSDSVVGMVFDDLLNKLLPVSKTIQEEIQELSSNDSGELPNITQTIRIYGTISNENPYSDYVGNVNIKEYINAGDATGRKVDKESFEVKKSSDGELIAVREDHGKETFNPIYQEMLDILIPSKSEFEDLIGLIKQAIKEGKAEQGEKNVI